MSNLEYCILGDWGTSFLRLYLYKINGEQADTLETKIGPGVKDSCDFESTLFECASPWIREYGKPPIILCGMISSSLGWIETPYLECPINLSKIKDQVTQVKFRGHKIAIAPGLTCRNPLETVDVLRGEETQILGWLHYMGKTSTPQLFCLPGTHTKWAIVRNTTVEYFLTGMQGELFDLLSRYSVLIPKNEAVSTQPEIENLNRFFHQGLELVNSATRASLIHTLFSTRSRTAREKLDTQQAREFLSGQTIGSDIRGALDVFKNRFDSTNKIALIGAPELTNRYAAGLQAFNLSCEIMDGSKASMAGLQSLYKQLNGKKAAA